MDVYSLTRAHRRALVEGSGIDPEVIAERGVRSVGRGRGEMPSVFSWRQKRRAPGILFTVHRPNGQTSWVFRPNAPDPKKPGYKYAQPPKKLGGSGNVLDVHPSAHDLVDDTSVPVVFTEGIKKSDAITSAARREGVGALAVAIAGVWNWLSEGEPIPDMYDIPVEGRRAFVCYDSDMLHNPNVQQAAERLAEHLISRGADVQIVFLPDGADGCKTGADDYLAGGGTLGEMLALSRPFDPEDVLREKLSRSERLRRSLDYLAGLLEEMPAKTSRDCSKRAAWRTTCLTLAARRGELVEDGIEVVIPALTGAEIAAMSQPTFSSCMRDFEEDGLLRRIKAQRRDHANSYVLLVQRGVLLYNDGERGSGAGEQGTSNTEPPHGYKVIPPLPEMRWSSLGSRKKKRGVVPGTRRPRQGSSAREAEPKRRPGKKRGEIVRYVLDNGGAATREELLERFGGPKTTWKDFKKQTLSDLLGRRRQYQGRPLSVGPPVLELADDGVRLAQDWEDALEKHRILGEEEEAAIKQKRDHLLQRVGYRKRDKTKAARAPTEEELAQRREARNKRREIDRLAEEGMARALATRAVLGADGFDGELSREEDPDPQENHPLDCECLGCSARAPSYVRLTGRAS